MRQDNRAAPVKMPESLIPDSLQQKAKAIVPCATCPMEAECLEELKQTGDLLACPLVV